MFVSRVVLSCHCHPVPVLFGGANKTCQRTPVKGDRSGFSPQKTKKALIFDAQNGS